MFSTKEFGQRVSNLRKVRNLTQDELAYRVNVNKGHISRIERGTVACSLELLIDLSNELHTSTDFLLTGIGPSNDFCQRGNRHCNQHSFFHKATAVNSKLEFSSKNRPTKPTR